MVTSYGLLARDAELLARASRFDYVILDEAQAIKNAADRARQGGPAAARPSSGSRCRARRSRTTSASCGRCSRSCFPGLLGSWEQFRARFAVPIERDRRQTLRVPRSRALIRPFLLRRTKAEVAPELPPRTEIVVPIAMSAPEARALRGRRASPRSRSSTRSRSRSDDGDKRASRCSRRSRACAARVHPRSTIRRSPVASSKMQRLLELIEELRSEGHRALVFSQFTSHLALVRARARSRGRHLPLPRRRDAAARARRARRRDSRPARATLFLISLKAGGTGLNLTARRLRDPPRSVVEPGRRGSGDRSRAPHRPEQAGHRLPAGRRDTVEEKVAELQQTKRDLTASIINADPSLLRRLDRETLEMLLS